MYYCTCTLFAYVRIMYYTLFDYAEITPAIGNPTPPTSYSSSIRRSGTNPDSQWEAKKIPLLLLLEVLRLLLMLWLLLLLLLLWLVLF